MNAEPHMIVETARPAAASHQPETLGEIVPFYPRFESRDAECVWLQSQLVRLQGMVAYQQFRMDVKIDLEEALMEFKRVLSERVEELEGENAELRRELARLMRYDPEKRYHDAASELLSGKVDWVMSRNAGRLIFKKAAAGSENGEAKNPNAGVTQAYPNGRFACKEKGGV